MNRNQICCTEHYLTWHINFWYFEYLNSLIPEILLKTPTHNMSRVEYLNLILRANKVDTVYGRRQHHLAIVGSHQWKSRNITHGLRMSNGPRISTSPRFVISYYRVAGSRFGFLLLEIRGNAFREESDLIGGTVVWGEGMPREPS